MKCVECGKQASYLVVVEEKIEIWYGGERVPYVYKALCKKCYENLNLSEQVPRT